MATYIICYDLDAPHRDYNGIETALLAMGSLLSDNPLKIQGSVWLLETPLSALQIRHNIEANLDFGDSLFIAELQGDATWIEHDQVLNRKIQATTN